MRSAGNFSSEWGYLAPAPSFFRTARIVLAATAIGATAGAGVVLSLVDHPAAEGTQTSMAAHAIVTSVHAAMPLASALPATAVTPVSAPSAGPDMPPATEAPVAVQAAVPVPAQDNPQAQVQTPPQAPLALATPAVAAQSSPPLPSPSSGSGAVKRADAHEASVVSPPPSPPATAVTSEAPLSADVEPDVSTAPVVEPGKKPTKNRSGPAVANSANTKNKPDPGLGSVLRHLFSARAGASYYPN
jgi:hypothetical protein